MTLSVQLKTIPLLVATSLIFAGCSSVNSDGLGSIVRPTTVVIPGSPDGDGSPTILDPVIGTDGVIPVASSPILDPIIGPDGILPLTSDNFEGDGGLLDPVVGQGGLLPVTSPDGGELLDGVIGPDGLLPLTTGDAGDSGLQLDSVLDNLGGGAPVTDLLGGDSASGLLDNIVGQGGLLPVTTPTGDNTLLDPIVVLGLTTGEATPPGAALLDPVIGQDGLLELTTPRGDGTGPLDTIVGPDGLLPLTTGDAGDSGLPLGGGGEVLGRITTIVPLLGESGSPLPTEGNGILGLGILGL